MKFDRDNRQYNTRNSKILILDDDGDVLIEEWKSNPEGHEVQLPFGRYEDLRVRTALIRASDYGDYEDEFVNSGAEARRFLDGMPDMPQEAVVIIILDVNRKVLGLHEVYIGSVREVKMAPAHIFQAAIVANASFVIVAHNHPSGNASLSNEDRSMAARLKQAGKLLGIEVLDFIVITRGKTTSYIEE